MTKRYHLMITSSYIILITTRRLSELGSGLYEIPFTCSYFFGKALQFVHPRKSRFQ